MSRFIRHKLVGIAAAAVLCALAAPALAQSVEAGIQAWQSGNYEEAVRNWRPLADRGDLDAQFNLGHAYRLGRGVPQNLNLAEQWYERAARAGHVEAQAMYGLILFQNNRQREAMPFVQSAAERGDMRAQYVFGTALFNGDLVAQDYPRAYAFMTRAAAQGLPYAQTQLAEMEQHISAQDRARGTELAQAMDRRTPARIVAGGPSMTATARPADTPPARVAENRIVTTPATAAPTRIATTDVPRSSAPAMVPARQVRPEAPRPAVATPIPASAGGWRVQLGAFSSEANARRAWTGVSGRLGGLQPAYVRAGTLIRLQAGPLPNRAAAERACAELAGAACFPVAS